MEYINDITINEGIIHILDNNADEPILNEYLLDMNDDIYKFLLKHVQKILRDEELKYAIFKENRNIVKDLSQEYLNGNDNLLNISKELSNQMFTLMRSNGNILSCDLLIVSISTEYGPMLGIMKMDYIKNYVHNVDYKEGKIGINIITQFTGLPGSGQKIQKAAFIKPMRDDNKFDLMVLDKKKKSKDNEEYGSNYFINNYLGCELIDNERDKTKNFLNAAEKWTRNNLSENADVAENVRSTIKKKLKDEESIDINDISHELFQQQGVKENFTQYLKESGVENNINIDKEWVEKKLKRVRLKIDKDIDLYVNEETYNDNTRFEIKRNGDGTINMVIKHVSNYIEK
ncbi:nucleoid-associated protein [Haloimpatiens sp. FM7330]|uniref:nucleoid-associated protein n=1 Tax=Haloimpatiens sp. FM7330 TaxID=3298610 RepID=UPI00362EDEE7